MKICYLVLAHNNPNHFKRLINSLSAPGTDVFIHIDAKSTIADFQTKEESDNIVFIKKRVRISWGGWSLVQATLNLLREALASGKEHDYYCLLSGSEYPLKSQTDIADFLKAHDGTEFISGVELPHKIAQKPMGRVTNYHIDYEFHGNNIFSRMIARTALRVVHKMKIRRPYERILKDMKPYGGSQWWALTRPAIHHIMRFTDVNKKFVRFFINAWIPDESFFHIIMQSSPFKKSITRSLTFDDWSDTTAIHPAIINFEHLHKAKKDGGIFADDHYGKGQLIFARKFPDDSETLLQFIHKEIW